MDKKYYVLFVASFVIEIASTAYISAVAEKNVFAMALWAFVGPFLGLPFLHYQIEAKTNFDRIKLALCYGCGYAAGAVCISQFSRLGDTCLAVWEILV